MDPDLVHTLPSQKVEFLHEKHTLCERLEIIRFICYIWSISLLLDPVPDPLEPNHADPCDPDPDPQH